MKDIKLTQYSHGAGCGCKISPAVLDTILHSVGPARKFRKLIVGNESKDDAAVYDIGNGKGLISTTDFFMPIVDDPFQFGRIASANAISDVYAMGGTPVMAIAILGWPVNKLPAQTAAMVLNGAREVCGSINIPLAGGHSIDSPEPIFGLAVNGLISLKNLKRNNTAGKGNLLYLTKPLGVGILTTAEKKGILKKVHKGLAEHSMTQLNSIGENLARVAGVTAMTDVTGFGLLGHLAEMCEGSRLSATLDFSKIPQLSSLKTYIDQEAIPGGTVRNWNSYGSKIGPLTLLQRNILCDPQTSGGLIVAVEPQARTEVEKLLKKNGLAERTQPIGVLNNQDKGRPVINIA
ncbi:MAG: selenide, water dikinase SelD [Bacteroidia bacterium]|nr:selenide, water dikinase SelD [Bacteroidia bacterium]